MINIYAVNIANLRESDLSFCRAAVSETRRTKTDRFRFEKDRIRCITGEALVRYAAETVWGIGPEAIHVRTDEYCRPYLFFPADGAGQYDFNISHSGDWVVCSFGTERSGIDVELVSKHSDSLAERVLSIREMEMFRALPEEEKPSAFCRIWTLKECYAKQIGIGLAQPFRELETQQLGPVTWQMQRDPERVLFSQPWNQDYYLSLCISAANHTAPETVVLDAKSIETYFMNVRR